MANYYGSFRTNYVELKDGKHQVFEGLLDLYGLSFISRDVNDIECVGFTCGEEDGGGLPSYYTKEDSKSDEEFMDTEINWKAFGPLMKEGQVLHIIEVGQEKLRYLTGFAMFIRSDSKIIYNNINAHPRGVKNFLKKHKSKITDCTY